MRALVFLFLLLLSLSLKAQYNKEAKHAIRLTPSYGGYQGLSLEAAFEYFIRPKHSVILGIESTYRNGSLNNFQHQHLSLNLGYRYNFLNWKKLELFAGLDLKNGIVSSNYYSKGEFKSIMLPSSSINAVIEANYNFNKNFSLFGKVSANLGKCDHCGIIDRIGLGMRYKF